MRKIYSIPDYEHSGDLYYGEQEVLETYPNAKIIRSWEERDYEAEYEYKDEYGECDEPIYKGYVEYEIPD